MCIAKELQAILKWCSILGLLPGYNSKTRCFVANRCYIFVVHCVLGLTYLMLVWGLVMFKYQLPIKIFYKSLTLFSTILQNFKLSIWNLKDINRLFYEMDQLDLKLVQRCNVKVTPQKYTTSMCVIVNIITALVYVSFIATWNIKNGYMKVAFSSAVIFDYLFSVQMTLGLFILRGICKRSRCVSQVVTGCSQTKYFGMDIGLLQRNISRIVDIYNELFGWNIFLHIVAIFVGILYTIYIYLARQGTGGSTYMLIPHFIALCLQLLHILVLSMQGQAVCKDSDAIISSCCELSKNSRSDQYRIRAMGLLQQVSVKQARISAAGFFEVNSSMVFLLINLLVTYIIALVQLMPN